MDKMHKIINQFDELPIRTRLIITFAGILTVFVLFELFWFSKTQAAIKSANQSIANLDSQILAVTEAQEQLNQGIFGQRNNPKAERLEQITAELTTVENQLQQKTKGLVKPTAMAGLLENILKESQDLKLISLVKQAPQPLFDDTNESNPVQMYKHPITLTFEGGYVATTAFIKKLESIQPQINFDAFEFSVENYPKSTITLNVSTISMSRKWIGG